MGCDHRVEFLTIADRVIREENEPRRAEYRGLSPGLQSALRQAGYRIAWTNGITGHTMLGGLERGDLG